MIKACLECCRFIFFSQYCSAITNSHLKIELQCFLLELIERKPSLIELRKYQEELVEIAVSGQNTIICAGTNAGKTYVAYHIIEDHLIKYPNGKIHYVYT